MHIPPFADPVPPSVDLLAQLCSQSGALHGIALRLTNANTALLPDSADGWRGPAAASQQAFVARLANQVDSVTDVLDAARELTDAAIWSVSSAG